VIRPINLSAILIGLTGLTGLIGFSFIENRNFQESFLSNRLCTYLYKNTNHRTLVLILIPPHNMFESCNMDQEVTGAARATISNSKIYPQTNIGLWVCPDYPCGALDINSTSVVNCNLERLVCLGYLIRTPAKARAFALTGSARELFEDHFVTDKHKIREEIRLLRAENDRIR